MLTELVTSAMHSSAQGFVGVTLIAVYFCLIVVTSLYRIKKSDSAGH